MHNYRSSEYRCDVHRQSHYPSIDKLPAAVARGVVGGRRVARPVAVGILVAHVGKLAHRIVRVGPAQVALDLARHLALGIVGQARRQERRAPPFMQPDL